MCRAGLRMVLDRNSPATGRGAQEMNPPHMQSNACVADELNPFGALKHMRSLRMS